MRFSQDHIRQWREDGFCVIENFFTEEEYLPLLADFEMLYGSVAPPPGKDEAMVIPEDDENLKELKGEVFKHIDTLPYYGSPELNLCSLHPDLIAFARALLGVPEVHLYQSHTWAKYTGLTDYEQTFHCDFGNHTLTCPAEEEALRTVDFIFYLTDVSAEDGALRYVTKPDARAILGHDRPISGIELDEHYALVEREKIAAVPAGSLLAHGIDTFHRGTNLTSPGGRRFSMTVGFKAAGNDQIAFHAWQTGAGRPWENLMPFATPDQLACLGVPLPGDPFWTPRTVEVTEARWPGIDMEPYKRGLIESE